MDKTKQSQLKEEYYKQLKAYENSNRSQEVSDNLHKLHSLETAILAHLGERVLNNWLSSFYLDFYDKEL